MSKDYEYDWPPSWLKHAKLKPVIFHDKEVMVYEGKVELGLIHLWRENNRTSLDIKHLAEECGNHKIANLSDDEIIDSIVKDGAHKITDLAKSIKMNGVRIPLILTYDREILDGNRRFIACKYLMKTEGDNDKYNTVIAQCLKPNLSKTLKYKIISEMNFLPDHKEKWPQKVRAEYICELFNEYERQYGKQDAIKKVTFLLDTDYAEILRFKEVLSMIGEYIKFAKDKSDDARKEAETFTRVKFHFFEEFYNKGIVNKGSETIIKEDKELFYEYIFKKQLLSTTRIRDFAKMLQYKSIKNIIKSKKDSLEYAKSMYDDIIIPKRASPMIKRFCEWLEGLSKKQIEGIEDDIKQRLIKAIEKLKR